MCSSNLNRFFVILSSIVICGCGAGVGTGSGGAAGALKLLINNSQSFDPNIEHARIEQYRVTVDAGDIETPIEVLFDGAASDGTVDDIPAGDDRVVTVQALNPNSAVIRQGEAFNVHVEGGETSDVEMEMESVPIIANIKSGNIIPNTRLKLLICSEPGAPVTVSSESASGNEPLFDVAKGAAEIIPDLSTGLASMVPQTLAVGAHKLTVTNENTGRSSTIDVVLTDGRELRPAPFASASFSMPAGSYVQSGRLGGSFGTGDPINPSVWPNVLATIVAQ